MADQLDVASDLAELNVQTALQKHKEKQQAAAVSAFYCIDCDEVIPHARREAITGVQLCVQCQQFSEIKQKQVAL